MHTTGLCEVVRPTSAVLRPRGDILDGPLPAAADRFWKSAFPIKRGGVATTRRGSVVPGVTLWPVGMGAKKVVVVVGVS